MRASRQNPQQALGVYLCLLAAILLYAPLSALAWNASSMSCCNGDHCPLHHHDPQKQQTHEMDCGHVSDEMAACSMSCCHTPEKVTLAALTFVLPRPAIAADAVTTAGLAEISQSNEIRSAREPLSPPPRLASVAV
jgi:hypothetical protein